jgi:hypothetical protein
MDSTGLTHRRYRADILQPRRSISAEGIRERLREVRTQSLQETPAKLYRSADAFLHLSKDEPSSGGGSLTSARTVLAPSSPRDNRSHRVERGGLARKHLLYYDSLKPHVSDVFRRIDLH